MNAISSMLGASLWVWAAGALGADHARLTGRVADTAGQPLEALTVRLWHQGPDGWDLREVVTGPGGDFTADLEPGVWAGVTDAEQLLRRGYFCVPGMMVCIDESGNFNSCGEGFIAPPWLGPISPIEIGPTIGVIDLTAVPITPTLTVTKTPAEPARVGLTFEVPIGKPTLIRRWRIEKSVDGEAWQAVQTVELAGSSPLTLEDAGSVDQSACFYRAVQVEDRIVTELGK